MKKVLVGISILSSLILLCTGIFLYRNHKNNEFKEIKTITYDKDKPDDQNTQFKSTKPISITISAIGDCTIGSDPNFGYTNSFHQIFDKNDSTYFFSGVKGILGEDDITLANLETTFTESTDKEPKAFNFKGPSKYTDILKSGSVEIVNIANNHILDFKEQGYKDTLEALHNAGIYYSGEDNYYIYSVKGLKIGFIGYYSNFNPNVYDDLKKGIDYLKDNEVDLIITSFHWGIEREYKQNEKQRKLAEYAIDLGSDLVIGHHPHVVQGIEEYKGKYIVYSLGNFVFGGNKNPKDKDTFIFQEKFDFIDNKLSSSSINIIPASLSGKNNINDYRPVILEGTEKERVMNKILKYSNLSVE